MTDFANACRASTRRCAEIAATTSTTEDRCEFTSFAVSWQRLADESECDDRLIGLIEELGSRPSVSSPAKKSVELSEQEASCNSLRRLATAVLYVSHHYLAGIAGDREEPDSAEQTGRCESQCRRSAHA